MACDNLTAYMTENIWKEHVTTVWLSVHFMSYLFIPFLWIYFLYTVVTLVTKVCTEYAPYLRCHI